MKDNKVTIVGAGLSGLIAGVMLRDQVSCIMEKQPGLPNNHTSVMRFRSRAVADATNIPFKKVNVAWGIDNGYAPTDLCAAMKYSYDCTGIYDPTSRSITRLLPGLRIGTRWISPRNLPIKLLGKVMGDVEYNEILNYGNNWPRDTIISTIPMPILAKILGYKFRNDVKFRHRNGDNFTVVVPGLDCYATLYMPYNSYVKRISIMGNRIIAESYNNKVAREDLPDGFLKATIEESLGVYLGWKKLNAMHSPQMYAKIVAIDETERRKFIRWATEKHNVYSLGRFATWRPGLLLDDVIQDVRRITDMISGNNLLQYEWAKEK